MDDIAEKLQQMLSSKEGQQQLQDAVQMLSGSDGNIDLSKVSSLLGGSDNPVQNESEQQNGNMDFSGTGDASGNSSGNSSSNSGGFNFDNLDMSKLGGILSGLNLSGGNEESGNFGNSGNNTNGFDLSKIMGMLGGGLGGGGNSGGGLNLGGLDINALMKIQRLLSAVNHDDKNIALIRAIKPHLKEERRSKADDAIKMMQLMSMLPLLRDSGLFGGVGNGSS